MTQREQFERLFGTLEDIKERLPQSQPAHTPEQIAWAKSMGVTLPEPVDPVKEKLDTIAKQNKVDAVSNDKKLNVIIAFLACVLLLVALPLLSFDGCKQNTPPPDKTVNVKTWGDKIYAEAVKKKIDPIGTGNAGNWPMCLTPSPTKSVRKS